MKAMFALLVAVVMTAGSASRSRGTEEWSFEAFQPVWTDNEIALSRVTIMTFNSTDVGVCAVLATCDSSLVKTDRGFRQRNAAFEVGLRVEVTYNSNEEPPLFGDTLRVVLRGTKPPVEIGDFDYSTIVAATVECVVANAAQSSAIKFVAIRTDKVVAGRDHGGVFATSPFRTGPKERVFRQL
jgi:hypothetical protein